MGQQHSIWAWARQHFPAAGEKVTLLLSGPRTLYSFSLKRRAGSADRIRLRVGEASLKIRLDDPAWFLARIETVIAQYSAACVTPRRTHEQTVLDGKRNGLARMFARVALNFDPRRFSTVIDSIDLASDGKARIWIDVCRRDQIFFLVLGAETSPSTFASRGYAVLDVPALTKFLTRCSLLKAA